MSSTSMSLWAPVRVWPQSLSDAADEVLEDVDGVDALVHQGAAAVEVPGAAPVAGVVVLLGAPPLYVGVGEDDLAELAGVDGFLDELGGGVEAVLADDGELLAGLFLGGDHAIAGFEGDFHGLFDDDVLAGFHGADGHVGVHAGGGADADDVEVFVGEEFGEFAVDLLDAELLGHVAGPFGDDVGDGDEFRFLRDLGNGRPVGGADGAAADDAELVHLFLCAHVRSLCEKSPGKRMPGAGIRYGKGGGMAIGGGGGAEGGRNALEIRDSGFGDWPRVRGGEGRVRE